MTYNHRYHALLRCVCLRAFPSKHGPFVSIHLLKQVMFYGTLNTLSLNWSDRQITDIITFFQTGRGFLIFFQFPLWFRGITPVNISAFFLQRYFPNRPATDWEEAALAARGESHAVKMYTSNEGKLDFFPLLSSTPPPSDPRPQDARRQRAGTGSNSDSRRRNPAEPGLRGLPAAAGGTP